MSRSRPLGAGCSTLIYPPDRDTRDGYRPLFANEVCPPANRTAEDTSARFPSDPTASTWPCASYWTDNHGTKPAPAGCTDTATISRFSVYKFEISQSAIADATSSGANGVPLCGRDSAISGRREINAAIVACGVEGNANPVNAIALGKFFIVSASDPAKLTAELVGLVHPQHPIIKLEP